METKQEKKVAVSTYVRAGNHKALKQYALDHDLKLCACWDLAIEALTKKNE